MIKLKNSHIKKLEREKINVKIYYENLLTEIMGKLERFPRKTDAGRTGDVYAGILSSAAEKV